MCLVTVLHIIAGQHCWLRYEKFDCGFCPCLSSVFICGTHVYEMVFEHREYETVRDDFVSLVIAHFGFVTYTPDLYYVSRMVIRSQEVSQWATWHLRDDSCQTFRSKFDEFIWQTTMTGACNDGISIRVVLSICRDYYFVFFYILYYYVILYLIYFNRNVAF